MGLKFKATFCYEYLLLNIVWRSLWRYISAALTSVISYVNKTSINKPLEFFLSLFLVLCILSLDFYFLFSLCLEQSVTILFSV